ncbi:trypsin-like serine peptidase [Streptomyces gilvosporeus]|nr:trypsin-like peptidase domain-containing protein [Streptomyces gilvosporeus]
MRRSTAAAVAAASLLALTATACGPGHSNVSASPGSSSAASQQPTGGADKAPDFSNPIDKGHWGAKRLAQAMGAPDIGIRDGRLGRQNDASNPPPRPVTAQEIARPYERHMAPVGKLVFDGPEGPTACSGTVVEDPAHPGRSNLVWTAGHCVHSGKNGSWMRDIVFVPSYNHNGVPMNQVGNTPAQEIAPYGKFWADWSITSNEWIKMGGPRASAGSAYDFAVLHVRPENNTGRSLQETVGAAAQVAFNAPTGRGLGPVTAVGYPSAAPFDGARMMSCLSRPSHVNMQQGTPDMDVIGCTMTAGSSGGGWLDNHNGKLTLVSNTSLTGPGHTMLVGPHLGPEAQQVFEAMSRKFANE